jgi:membrane protein YdbS with pleckstrin-like domain
METDSGERTLMVIRQVRLKNLKNYVTMFVFLIIAGYLQFFRPSFLPAYDLLDRWDVYYLLELLLVFIAFISVIVAEVKRVKQEYLVTNLRIIDSYGILKKTTTVMMANQVERVYSTQGILQRLLRYGDVVVDTGEDQVVLEGVHNPKKVEGAITQAMASRLPSRR